MEVCGRQDNFGTGVRQRGVHHGQVVGHPRRGGIDCSGVDLGDGDQLGRGPPATVVPRSTVNLSQLVELGKDSAEGFPNHTTERRAPRSADDLNAVDHSEQLEQAAEVG